MSQTNITRIRAVYNALGELQDKVVFVGGATVSLYADGPPVEARPTDDVDVVIELASYSGYSALDEKLRSIGFRNDIESGVICRYRIKGIIVDVMPVEENILGFNNKWYPEAFENAVSVSIDEKGSVKIFHAPYFLASKIEAFNERGDDDGRTSSDFEDIVFVLEHRRAIWQELKDAPSSVKSYLKKEFRKLLSNPFFEEWVSCHVDQSGSPSAEYLIIPELQAFTAK